MWCDAICLVVDRRLSFPIISYTNMQNTNLIRKVIFFLIVIASDEKFKPFHPVIYSYTIYVMTTIATTMEEQCTSWVHFNFCQWILVAIAFSFLLQNVLVPCYWCRCCCCCCWIFKKKTFFFQFFIFLDFNSILNRFWRLGDSEGRLHILYYYSFS